MRQAKTAIVLSNRDVRELRQLQRESQRSRAKRTSTDHAFLAELRTARTDRPARGTAPMRALVVSFLFQQNQN